MYFGLHGLHGIHGLHSVAIRKLFIKLKTRKEAFEMSTEDLWFVADTYWYDQTFNKLTPRNQPKLNLEVKSDYNYFGNVFLI